MPALIFKKRFAEAVETNKQTCALIPRRKRAWKVGDKLYLQMRVRMNNVRTLGEAILTKVSTVTITEDSLTYEHPDRPLTLKAKHGPDRLAQNCGFPNFTEMINWYRDAHGLPFTGDLLKWKLCDG